MGRPPRSRTRRSYVMEIVCYAAIWVVDAWQIARHFRTMALLPGLTAGMMFLIAPVTVWRAYTALRESRDE